MNQEPTDLLTLIRACVDGNPHARRRFQAEYGKAIYTFPMKQFSLPRERAADFYVYVFDNDRIFSRIRHFKGDHNNQFFPFLWGLVLKHLFIEWQRTLKEVETISLSTPVTGSPEGGSRVLEDVLPGPATVGAGRGEVRPTGAAGTLWSSLSPEEQLTLKLLNLLEHDLDAADLRLLAKLSGRSLRETLMLVTEVQANLRRKDERLSQLRDTLDSVWGWILLRQKELQEINEKIRSFMAGGGHVSPGGERLLARKQELEETLAKRFQQRDQIVGKMRNNRLTTPYKDIARLRNSTVGTVCSQMARLRERLLQKLSEGGARKEQAS